MTEISVKDQWNKVHVLALEDFNITVEEVKTKLEELTGHEVFRMELMLNNTHMDDEQKLSDYNLRNRAQLRLRIMMGGC